MAKTDEKQTIYLSNENLQKPKATFLASEGEFPNGESSRQVDDGEIHRFKSERHISRIRRRIPERGKLQTSRRWRKLTRHRRLPERWKASEIKCDVSRIRRRLPERKKVHRLADDGEN
jgi:hypothetical protein